MVIQIQAPSMNFSAKQVKHKAVQVKHKAVQVEWTKEKIMEAFRSYDKDGDGKLSKAELKQAFKMFGSYWGSLRATQAMARADNDRSGFIEITDKELEELVDYAFQLGYKIR